MLGFVPQPNLLTICLLDDESEYIKQVYRGNDVIESKLFPELKLTAKEVLGV